MNDLAATIRRRASLLREIREFFHDRDFIEVDTPALAPDVIPESTIEVMETHSVDRGPDTRRLWLLPSPEKWLKRLICSGLGACSRTAHSAEINKIYQLSHVFRMNEPESAIHTCEFTMLEWYGIESGYMDELDTTLSLLEHLSHRLGTEPVRIETLSVHEAFLRYANLDLEACRDIDEFRRELTGRDTAFDERDDWADLFHRVLLQYVEPAIEHLPGVVLVDYPHQVRCLAKRKAGTLWRERWELYMYGIEIANCYSEETDPGEIREIFSDEQASMPGRDECYDTALIEAHHSAPRYSGVALGVDRLMMVLYGYNRIDDVAVFLGELRGR